jgi:hypothetical protein
VINKEELQHLLRQFPNLEGCEVKPQSALLLPENVTISGAINCYGEYMYWEVSMSLRDFKTADDVLGLVNSLNQSFEKAANNTAVH